MTPLPQARGAARGARRPRKVTEARWVAYGVVRRTFDDDAFTDRVFASAAADAGLSPRDRSFAQRLAYGTVQRAKTLDHVVGVVGKRPLRKIDAPVLHALRLGMYELLVLRGESGTSAHAAVDQAVEIVRGVVGERAVAFANAVLRRAQVDGAGILAALDPTVDADAAVLMSMPEWLVSRVRASHGDTGIDALAAQSGDDSVRALLDDELKLGRGAPTRAGAPIRIVRADAAREIDRVTGVVSDLKPFPALLPDARAMAAPMAPLAPFIEAGDIVPQSLASQLVVAALAPEPGERVLDMCAAPGGKTISIAQRVAAGGATGSVVACELHLHRADSVVALAQRTGTSNVVEVRVADSTSLDPEEYGTFDRVLVDAPCSGTGVLAARPDSRWKRDPDAIGDLVRLQRRLLESASRLVRPGGVVLYSTCSILVEEDEDVADDAPAVLVPDRLPDVVPASLRDSRDDSRARTWPHEHGTDGFFLARFRRATEGLTT